MYPYMAQYQYNVVSVELVLVQIYVALLYPMPTICNPKTYGKIICYRMNNGGRFPSRIHFFLSHKNTVGLALQIALLTLLVQMLWF